MRVRVCCIRAYSVCVYMYVCVCVFVSVSAFVSTVHIHTRILSKELHVIFYIVPVVVHVIVSWIRMRRIDSSQENTRTPH